MSASLVNTEMAAAAAAIGIGDYATAKQHALTALAYLIAIPDGGFRTQGAIIEYDRGAIKDLIAQCDRQLAADTGMAGIQRTKIQWARPSAAV